METKEEEGKAYQSSLCGCLNVHVGKHKMKYDKQKTEELKLEVQTNKYSAKEHIAYKMEAVGQGSCIAVGNHGLYFDFIVAYEVSKEVFLTYFTKHVEYMYKLHSINCLLLVKC